MRTVGLVRLIASLCFVAVGGWRSSHGGAGWAAALPTLLAYAASSLVLGAVLSHEASRRAASVVSPFVDLFFTFAALMEALPDAPSPQGLAGASLGIVLAIVVFASLTLGADLIGATTVLAFLCTAAVQHEAGLPADTLYISGLMLGTTALLTGWGALRAERLAARLVEEEVARRLALERGDELERGNKRIAEINAELEMQHARLLLAQREAETVMGLLVHDMKQPLASIQCLVEVVEEELQLHHSGSGRLREDLAIARRQGERLLAMVADLLAISRLEQGAMTAKKQPTQLRPLLGGLADAHRPRALGVALTAHAPEGLAATLDRELVQRLLENLLANAIAFTRPGDRIDLSARREGALVVFSVRNSGPPVPDDARPLLFEKLITNGGRARHNAGLGLYFCRLVAEAHGGRIALEHDPDFNVAFSVRLPADAQPDTPPATQRLARLVRG